jgi:hypothetical protein
MLRVFTEWNFSRNQPKFFIDGHRVRGFRGFAVAFGLRRWDRDWESGATTENHSVEYGPLLAGGMHLGVFRVQSMLI